MRKRENKNWWLVWVAMCCLSFTTQAVPLVEDIPVSSITISPSIDTLFLGQKLTLTCKFLPVNATQKSVFWISDDENVATVKAVNDSMAVVTAQSKGVVTILATTEDGLFLNARLKLIVDDFYDKVFLIDSISYRMSREEALAVDVVGFIETTHLIIPDSVKILDDLYSVKSILLEKGKTLKKKLAALSVPSTVKRILLREDCIGKNFSVYVSDLEAWCHTDFEGEYPDSVAIYLNNKLITDLDIPGSYGYLGRAVFVNNKNLRGVNIGEGVTSVNAYAFAGCSNLERVILPKSLKEISYGMFREWIENENKLNDLGDYNTFTRYDNNLTDYPSSGNIDDLPVIFKPYYDMGVQPNSNIARLPAVKASYLVEQIEKKVDCTFSFPENVAEQINHLAIPLTNKAITSRIIGT